MRTISLLALGIALIAIVLNVYPAVAQDSSIIGSYELLSRDLKRGKKIDAPQRCCRDAHVYRQPAQLQCHVEA